jgi:hypothetical protein
MINFSLHEFIAARMLLSQEVQVAFERGKQNPAAVLSDADKTRLRDNLGPVKRLVEKMLLNNTENRLVRVYSDINLNISYFALAQELRVLFEAMEDDIKTEYFYHYPHKKGSLFLRVQGDWTKALSKFPAIAPEIKNAVDCYALGHPTATVFHLMRTMEAGVQIFGRKLGVSLTQKTTTKIHDLTWHNILDALNPKLSAMKQDTQARKVKYERYRAVQGYLYAVKDAWRNPTMHPRKAGYSDEEALGLINLVCSFMNDLACL